LVALQFSHTLRARASSARQKRERERVEEEGKREGGRVIEDRRVGGKDGVRDCVAKKI
jgi:hypothetical protein